MTKLTALLVLFACLASEACAVVGWVEDGAVNVAGHAVQWTACPTNLIDCGHVYMCDAYADNELGHVELCVDDDDHPEQLEDVQALYGACIPTPRHEGLCVMKCHGESGCNALSGCYCPSP